MTERMASGWMTVGGWCRGAKAIRKDAVKMDWAQLDNLGAISPRKAKKCKSEALKRAYEELKEMAKENIISAVRRRDKRPICVILCR